MSSQSVTMKQLSDDTGVPYSTIRSWNKSRPELVEFLFNSYDSKQAIIELQRRVKLLTLKLNHAHKMTEV